MADIVPFIERRAQATDILAQECEGWLAYDFRRSNSLACYALGIDPGALLTRRFFYWVPVQGDPVKIVHGIEPGVLDHLPGESITYRTWQELDVALKNALEGVRTVAMEYSPRNAIPYLSKVDAGTVDWVRSLGIDVVSSGNFIQYLTSVLTQEQIRAHLTAEEAAVHIMREAWQWIKHALQEDKLITDWAVQKYILDQIAQRGLITEVSPLCALNANTADPHFMAVEDTARFIRKGDFIMIDLGCKVPGDAGVYADITHVGIAAKNALPIHHEVFKTVKAARDAACTFVQERFERAKPLTGAEVDRCTRTVIEEAGYGEYFIHRTGHNIGYHEHGDGAHLDSYETEDNRQLLPGTCFSIEPGIYLPGDFGVRLEHDVLVLPDGEVRMTGGMQHELHYLLAD
ncbi:MAG: M24 family metallopeptidase [Parachlamydiales bacterium]|jgi:Xaa-Pro aminopeptidase